MEQSIFAGFASGVSQTLIGHPFDTWKTRSQISQISNIKNFHQIAYRGLSIPLLFNASYQSFIFTSTHKLHEKTKNWWNAGITTGIVGGLLSVPLEGHKVIRQCQCQNLNIREIPWKNVIFASVIRESFGTSIYFATYYWKQPVYREEPIKLFLWGGFSGWVSWLFSYPFDTYKTRFQTNIAQTWKQAIMKQPYMGFAVFSLRCFIVNAVGLTTYEKITS